MKKEPIIMLNDILKKQKKLFILNEFPEKNRKFRYELILDDGDIKFGSFSGKVNRIAKDSFLDKSKDNVFCFQCHSYQNAFKLHKIANLTKQSLDKTDEGLFVPVMNFLIKLANDSRFETFLINPCAVTNSLERKENFDYQGYLEKKYRALDYLNMDLYFGSYLDNSRLVKPKKMG